MIKEPLFKECNFPIICSAMNGVSDVNLAIAIKNAGVVPSMIFDHRFKDAKQLAQELNTFREYTSSSECIISGAQTMLLNTDFISVIDHFKVTHIEILNPSFLIDLKLLEQIKKTNVKVIIKESAVYEYNIEKYKDVFNLLDGIILKNGKGAGLNFEHQESDIEQINKTKNLLPHLNIIMSGGIGNSKDISDMLKKGVDYVGVGTLFALSVESSIPNEIKQNIISNKHYFRKLVSKKISTDNIRAIFNCVIFDEECLKINDDNNNTQKLLLGLKQPNKGLVYMGEGLSQVNNILNVKTIVNNLTGDL